MKKLSMQGEKWLKCIHVFFACLMIAGGVSMILMMHFLKAEDGLSLYGMHVSMKFNNMLLGAAGGMGTLLTGLLYSVFTNWGWFKHKWIILKWCINLLGVILGSFWLGPWIAKMVEIVKSEGMAALTNAVYVHSKTMSFSLGSFQFLTLLFALYLSVHKPWKRKKDEED
ncbi:MAG: hypothetical protein JW882_17250 [Deltaproteobacteria bacterium]|nr:hypothetical protein [Deltaproteobacteria bacterium]